MADPIIGISKSRLLSLIKQTYESGWHGCLELAEGFSADAVDKCIAAIKRDAEKKSQEKPKPATVVRTRPGNPWSATEQFTANLYANPHQTGELPPGYDALQTSGSSGEDEVDIAEVGFDATSAQIPPYIGGAQGSQSSNPFYNSSYRRNRRVSPSLHNWSGTGTSQPYPGYDGLEDPLDDVDMTDAAPQGSQ